MGEQRGRGQRSREETHATIFADATVFEDATILFADATIFADAAIFASLQATGLSYNILIH